MSVVRVLHRIDAAHWLLARLFFDDMRNKSWRSRTHEDAVEERRIKPNISENRTDRAIDIDRKRLARCSKRSFKRARGSDVSAVDTCKRGEFKESRRARIFSVNAMTKAAEAFASRFELHHRRVCSRINRDVLTRRARDQCCKLARAIFDRTTVMTIDRHDARSNARPE